MEFRFRDIRRYDEKLVAAITIAMLRSEGLGEQLGGLLEDPIALVVTLCVVYYLEVIEVNHHHRDIVSQVGFRIHLKGRAIADLRETVRE